MGHKYLEKEITELLGIADRLSKLSREDLLDLYDDDFEITDRDLLAIAKMEYKRRRDRDDLFGNRLFGEPAWDILLDALVALLEDRRVSVTSVGIASAAPITTAYRYIAALEQAGLLERRNAEHDHRFKYLILTQHGLNLMRTLFSVAYSRRRKAHFNQRDATQSTGLRLVAQSGA